MFRFILILLATVSLSYGQFFINSARFASGATTYSLVQSHSYQSSGSATSHTNTLTSTPTQNNLLVHLICGAGTVPSTPSGWSTTTNKADNTQVIIYYKVAGAGESKDCIFGQNVSAGAVSWVGEFSGMATSTPLDQIAGATGQNGAGATISTGTTGTTSQADELCVAIAGRDDTASTFSSFNNSFTFQASLAASTFNVKADIAIRKVAATGTYSTTATYGSGGTGHAVGAIATFKITTP